MYVSLTAKSNKHYPIVVIQYTFQESKGIENDIFAENLLSFFQIQVRN